MSHTDFYILVNLDPEEDDAIGDAYGTFEHRYAYDNCDENNWHNELYLVKQNGEIVINDYEYKSMMHNYPHWIADVPQEQRWDTLLQYIREESKSMLGENTDQKLIDLMSKTAAHITENGTANSWSELYRLRQQIEAVMDSNDQTLEPFHTAMDTPYRTELPYFDLRDTDDGSEMSEENLAILVVDIHT